SVGAPVESELKTYADLGRPRVEHGDHVAEVIVEQVEIDDGVRVQRVIDIEHRRQPGAPDLHRFVDAHVEHADIVRTVTVEILDKESARYEVGQRAVGNDARVRKAALISKRRRETDVA